MRISNSFRKTLVLLLFACLPASVILASDESYIQALTGKIKQGDSCVVIDDKFLNLPLDQWNQVRHLSVHNIVSFELRSDTSIYFHNKSFTCTLNVSIKYYTSRDQQTPSEINNVQLVVRYDTARGAFYPVDAHYQFNNAFKVIVVVNSITSPELGESIPAVFRLKNTILVNRKYPFNPHPTGSLSVTKPGPRSYHPFFLLSNLFVTITSQLIDGQLVIGWNTAEFGNAEEYDVEWTFIDRLSTNGQTIALNYGNGASVPVVKAEEWMKNNSTRVTVGGPSYTINLPYHEGYILVRIRGVSYTLENVRHEGDWQYEYQTGLALCIPIDDHEPEFNWQYTASYAEEGKRKEVITYFDGALRNHQSVTLSNSDKTLIPGDPEGDRQETAIVQETIHDEMGRPAMSILPVPTPNKSLNYYHAFNKAGGEAYSHANIQLGDGSSCTISSSGLDITSGTGGYYSSSNPFLNDNNFYFTRYVPTGGGSAFKLTEFVKDNTGRIRRQGGLGSLFAVSGGRSTRYFYGKPGQDELDRLFGSEAGDKSHYLKNMIIDPNGQATVSYIDTKGRTIATALAGSAGSNRVETLPSANNAMVHLNQRLIDPGDFRRDAGNLSMQASTVFLAATPGTFDLHYSANPAAVITQHSLGQFCSNCYYTILIEVRDPCGGLISSENTSAFTANDVTCQVEPPTFSGTLTFPVSEPGEYTITYTLQLSEDVINYQTDYYIENNSDLFTLQHFFEEELEKLDLSGCYSDCEPCKTLGDTPDKFREKVIALLSTEKFAGINIGDANSYIQQWINTTWSDLKAKCALLPCQPSSACEDNLQQMKFDVLPGGQYAPYGYDETTEVYAYTERTINVLRFYNLNIAGNEEIYNFTFTDDNGNPIQFHDLSESDFIKAYIDHPEWADMFVKKHIEYCSYLWCKDPGYLPANKNNETSYTFDKTLRESVADGADAIARGYYNRQNMFALLDADPFFNGGRGNSWKDEMQQDMTALSTAIKFIVRDQNGTILPAKNIFDFVDWMLYCKPIVESATANDFINSWSSCSPSTACRTTTLEWEMYRNYYLKLKGKYLQLVKGQVDPSCVNCFIGQDALTATTCPPPGPLSDYSVVVGGSVPNDPLPLPTYSLVYKNGTAPFKGTYRVKIRVHWSPCETAPATDEDFEVITIKGQLRVDNIITCRCNPDAEACDNTTFEILSVECISGQPPQTTCTGDVGTCPPTDDFSAYKKNIVIDPSDCVQQYYDMYLKHQGGPVQQAVEVRVREEELVTGTTIFYWVLIPAGETEVYLASGQLTKYPNEGCDPSIILQYTILDTRCPNNITSGSTCTNDPNYLLYGGKNRIFNEYVDEQFHLDCMADNAPTSGPDEQANLAQLRALAMQDLEVLKTNWADYLAAVDEEEAFGIGESVRTNLINALYEVAKKWIQIAPKGNIRPASTLPAGQSSALGHISFADAFDDYISPALQAQGFSADLLAWPYPHDRTPIMANPNSADITATVCANLTTLKNRWATSGVPTFHGYLKQELEEDYTLTVEELTDLDNRCTAGCRYMEKPVLLPAAFVAPAAPNGHMFVDCNTVNGLRNTFLAAYPGIAQSRKLFRVLYTNYLNHQLGYPLAYNEYATFTEKCGTNASAVLYNKPVSPFVIPDDFGCTADLLARAYERAGQEYERYIVIERKKFRNKYIATCLANSASARIEGDQLEYHYTLYYYDQSGNLVKTIPPEGVRFLDEDQVDEVDRYRQLDPATCVNTSIPTSEDKTATLNSLSTALQVGAGKSLELWLNNTSSSADRQVRFITPDNKYMYQAAIHDNKLWVELYTLSPAAGGVTEVTLTNEAVADISGMMLQSWSHLVVQSDDFTGAPWDLFLDGVMLTLIPPADAPPYPFAWEIGANEPLPADELSLLKHLRLYERIIEPQEVFDNYRNACLGPEGMLGATPGPLLVWGRFNIATLCGSGETIAVDNRGALQVTENLGWRTKILTDVTNNFTVELWVNPQQAHEIDIESQTGTGGTSGQAWAIYPTNGGSVADGKAGMGISVGTNGVSVYEHADGYLPALLVWPGSITGWTHIAIVYTNKTPSLYINGNWVHTGVASTKQYISPCYNFGAGAFGFMPGGLDEARIWSMSRTAQQIAAHVNEGVLPSEAGLVGYWPMSTSDGAQLEDFSCNNRPYELANPHTWLTTGAPVTDRVQVEYAQHFLVPQHGLPTTYAYNSLNQVIKQTSPDGGTSQFFFDRLGRLTVSQSAEQLESSVEDIDNRFSYTIYDELGRIKEVGEKIGGGFMSEIVARENNLLTAWFSSGSNRQVTQTIYDEAPVNAPGILANLRKRVAATVRWEHAVGGSGKAASYYSYDISGNVKTLYQENDQLATLDPNSGIKRIDYEYDLISGKTNKVKYQEGKGDQFYYDYRYDADNRLVEARTSRDNLTWNTEATYRYYLHGPLARTELGHYKVQGLDYAYTLQGWLKGINSERLDADRDMSGDGKIGSPFQTTARDVIAFSLGYYGMGFGGVDYDPIGGSPANAFELIYQFGVPNPTTGFDLFNGNISHATLALRGLDDGALKGYTYRYDQLSRLTKMRMHTIGSSNTWNNTTILDAYQENVSYDANGNIKTYLRHGNDPGNPGMDNLVYHYNRDADGQLLDNKLRHVVDNVTGDPYSEDISAQNDDNYTYDKGGNLITDQQEKIARIKWNAYGKIASIFKDETTPGPFGIPVGIQTTIAYRYDAMGNRISKSVTTASFSEAAPPPPTRVTTFYVRDGKGNVLSTYRHAEGPVLEGGTGLVWKEQHLYGSSRLGMWTPNIEVTPTWAPPVGQYEFNVGERLYELTNHLGNVMTTINDVVVAVDENNDQVTDYHEVMVVSANDYYPFGMKMPGRRFSWTSVDAYRYGFNGKENDDDVKGEGNLQDYGLRMYDTRLGRFMSVDPLTGSYPWYTPYQFSGNSPIKFIDLDGAEPTSNPADAQKEIDRAKKGLPQSTYWKNIKPADFLKNLEANIHSPARLCQGFGTNFCGSAAISHQLITRDPVGYVKLMIDLYQNGQGTYYNGKNYKTIKTDKNIQEAGGTLVYPGKFKGTTDLTSNPADQMLLLTLSNTYRDWFNKGTRSGSYEKGKEGKDFPNWAGSVYSEFNDMAQELLGYKINAIGGTVAFNRPLLGVDKDYIVEYINGELTKGDVYMFKNVISNGGKIAIGTHYQRIHCISLSPDGKNFHLTIWDYGVTHDESYPVETFRQMVNGITTFIKPEPPKK